MADAKQDQGASEKAGYNGQYGPSDVNKTKVSVPQGEIKLKNGVQIAINPNRVGEVQDMSSNAAQYRPGGGKGGIVSHFDQYFGEYIAEQEKKYLMSFSHFVEELELGNTEEFFEVPDEHEYEDWGEEEEEAVIYPVIHEAKGPCWTGHDMVGMKKKGGRKVPNCVPVKDAEKINKPRTVKEEDEKGGRKVKLGKPFLTPGENKKRAVYVKNDKGNVVKVRFGDPNMRIKKSSPSHRKSFRARHGCDVDAGPRWKAKYWSCKQW